MFVMSNGDEATEPVVFQWDANQKRRGRRLEVVRFKSYWKPELGEQWYVVYRDLSRETPLRKRAERMELDYRLPEWDGSKTIADLVGRFTSRGR